MLALHRGPGLWLEERRLGGMVHQGAHCGPIPSVKRWASLKKKFLGFCADLEQAVHLRNTSVCLKGLCSCSVRLCTLAGRTDPAKHSMAKVPYA